MKLLELQELVLRLVGEQNEMAGTIYFGECASVLGDCMSFICVRE